MCSAASGGKPARLGYSGFTPHGVTLVLASCPIAAPSGSRAARCAGLVQMRRVRLVPTLGEVFFFSCGKKSKCQSREKPPKETHELTATGMAFFTLPWDSSSQPLPVIVAHGAARRGAQPHAGQQDKASEGAVSHRGLRQARQPHQHAAKQARCLRRGTAHRDAEWEVGLPPSQPPPGNGVSEA